MAQSTGADPYADSSGYTGGMLVCHYEVVRGGRQLPLVYFKA